MNSMKPLQWAGIVLGVSLALYFIYSHLQYFRDVSFLGGILLLEVIIASLWKYDQRFFVLLMITFVWAGMNAPCKAPGQVDAGSCCLRVQPLVTLFGRRLPAGLSDDYI